MAPTPAPMTLRAKALQWLAQREQSRTELRAKLLRWARAQAAMQAMARPADAAGHAEPSATEVASEAAAEVDRTLDALEAAGHLSQARFVESRIHARAARFGNRRIELELRQHGASADADARAALKASELERARKVWAARFGLPAADAGERARQMRFLAGRGFTPEVIRRVVAGSADAD